MRNKIILSIFFILFLAQSVCAVNYPIVSDNTVDYENPDDVFSTNNILYTSRDTEIPSYMYIYIDLGTTDPLTLYLSTFSADAPVTDGIEIANVSSYDTDTLTWNTRPITGDYILAKTDEGELNSFYLPEHSRYITIRCNVAYPYYYYYVYSIENSNEVNRPYYVLDVEEEIITPDSISNISNTLSYTWINWVWENPSVNFGHVEIYIDGTFVLNTTASSYNLTGLTYNTQKTISTRTAAPGEENVAVNASWVNNTATTLSQSHTLSYNMSTPYIEGNFIKSQYSINVNLWSNPYFVWGNYVYTNTTTKKECLYKGSNVFACDLLPGSYSFNMSYSSFTDYNTSGLTFYTADIHVGVDTSNTFNTNKINVVTRENTLKEKSYTYLYIIFLIIIVIGIASFGKRNNDYDRR